MNPATSDPRQILKKYWGFDAFRPLQEDIIRSALDGKDTLALLPTGGGKSLCYQVPAIAAGGITLVISPLIALMKDQVGNLRKRGVKAVAVNSAQSSRENDLNLNNCMHGDIRLLYISPERLESRDFREALANMPVSLLAVDEAHCISQWGYDFRPPYLRIADIRAFLPHVPVLALTATATPQVVDDIQQRLGFRQRNVIQGSFYRENLVYHVFREEDKRGRLIRIFSRTQGSGIVYVRNRRKTAEIAAFLGKAGIPSAHYHAGLDPATRNHRQDEWMNGKTRVIVATNAFGMGIDKPDVRVVVHYDLPDCPEAYFQEAGRAGRDGQQAYGVILHDEADLLALRTNLDLSFPEPATIRKVYHALGNYMQLPVGSGADTAAPFDLNEFVATYGFTTITAYNALSFLEREGLILFREDPDESSKVMIVTDAGNLYHFQLSHQRYENLLKTLLRSYGSLFTDLVPVYEGELAKRTGLTKDEVEKQLSALDKMEILRYEKMSASPRMVFPVARMEDSQVLISRENYHDRKRSAEERVRAMEAYVTAGKGCRSSLLLAYFGETGASPCGRCDLCLATARQGEKEEKGETKILKLLEKQPMTTAEILSHFSEGEEENVISLLRFLTDAGKISRKKGKDVYERKA